MDPGGYFETSMLVPLVILVSLVKIQIVQGYSKSGRFIGRLLMSNFFANIYNLSIKTLSNIL